MLFWMVLVELVDLHSRHCSLDSSPAMAFVRRVIASMVDMAAFIDSVGGWNCGLTFSLSSLITSIILFFKLMTLSLNSSFNELVMEFNSLLIIFA